MPFKSDKQRKWMHTNEPEMAKKWEKEEESVNEFKSFSNRFRNMDTIRIKDQKEYKRIMKYLDKRGYQYYDIGHGKGEWHIQFDNTRETSRIRRELEKKRFKIIDPNLGEAAERDYKDEYKKFQSSPKSKKYRAELNKYNRKKGTYGNGDGKDASHKGGKISGFEKESVNRGRREKSRLKKEQKLREAIRKFIREDFAGAQRYVAAANRYALLDATTQRPFSHGHCRCRKGAGYGDCKQFLFHEGNS